VARENASRPRGGGDDGAGSVQQATPLPRPICRRTVPAAAVGPVKTREGQAESA
jgi:hypothetical protein